jgi:hypothetical protein
MRVLVACEYSGTVRDAFLELGHDAMSCDLIPTENPGPHYQGSVFDIINDGWDLMIGHPPCTYLSYTATSHWNEEGRCKKRLEALDFFRRLWEAPINRICLENPKGCASPTIAKYTQEIQPYFFGDEQMKTTWLWLKNLPKLKHFEVPTLFDNQTHCDKPSPVFVTKKGKNIYFSDAFSPSKDRAKARAKFWPGIAQAMAEQWGTERAASMPQENGPKDNIETCNTSCNT